MDELVLNQCEYIMHFFCNLFISLRRVNVKHSFLQSFKWKCQLNNSFFRRWLHYELQPFSLHYTHLSTDYLWVRAADAQFWCHMVKLANCWWELLGLGLCTCQLDWLTCSSSRTSRRSSQTPTLRKDETKCWMKSEQLDGCCHQGQRTCPTLIVTS